MGDAVKDAFLELANGHFESGLDKLNQDPWWHDDCFDLTGPFRLGFPGDGWGEDLLAASLLKREAVNQGMSVKVFADWQVRSILKQDPSFDVLQKKGEKKEGRSPLAILIHALTGELLEKQFIPLSPQALRSQPTDRRRIGIAWTSINKYNERTPEKSVPVKQFLDTLDGISGDFVSLQRNLEIADPNGLLRKFGARIVSDDVLNTKSDTSLDTLVKEIRQLDCLVTISTTTTHIAAALGVNVVLIAAERTGRQWFWQAQANHQKCFYPTVKVYIGEGEKDGWWKKCLEPARASLEGLLRQVGNRGIGYV